MSVKGNIEGNKKVNIKSFFIPITKNYLPKIIVGLGITILGGYIVSLLIVDRDYLQKNSAKIKVTLNINKLQHDSVLYSIKIKNIGKISASNIRYCMAIQDFQSGTRQFINQALVYNESVNLFILPTLNPLVVENEGLSILLFMYYSSYWEGDSLSLKEKYTFLIPKDQLSLGVYDPVAIQSGEKVFDESQIDSFFITKKINELNGSLGYILYEDTLQELNYFIRLDSIALLYEPKTREVIFQKLFSNDSLLTIREFVEKRDKNYHVIILNWNNFNYTLYINGDSSKNYIWQEMK